MEKCAKFLVDTTTGSIKQVISEMSCDPQVTTQFSWEHVDPIIFWTSIGVILFVVVALWFTVGYPKWNVWASKKSGEAAFAEAQNEQRVQLSQAQARKEAATTNKEAAIIEAEAVSAQIEKIGANLTKHDLYLKWQWIKMMEERPEASTIYIPTEAGMPILEAGNRRKSAEEVKDEE